MGVRFEDIYKGALETGGLLVKGMEQWNQATGKAPSVATAPIVAAAPAGGAVSAQPQGQSTTPGKSGLASIPGWVWLVGLGLLAWRYR